MRIRNNIKSVSCVFVLFLLLIFCSCGDDYVVKIGGNKISYDEYRYYYLNTKNDLINEENDSSDISDEQIKEEAMQTLCHNYGIINLAKKYDVELDSDDYDTRDQRIEEIKNGYSTNEEYLEELADSFQSEELLNKNIEFSILWDKVYNYVIGEGNGILMVDDETLLKDIEENFARADQILIKNDSGDNSSDNYLLACELYDRLQAGEDFDTLKSQYSEDSTTSNDSDGYYFTHGQMQIDFEETAFSLEEGQYSGVVTSDLGYHIIKRLPMEDEYINDNMDELRICCLSRKFNEMLDDEISSMKIVYAKDFDLLEFK